MSLHLTQDKDSRLTLVNHPTGYILKPQTKRYSSLLEAEYLVMQMAKRTEIKTVPFALMQMQDDSYACITRHIDRILPSKKVIYSKYLLWKTSVS